MTPPPPAFIEAATARIPRNTPVRLTLITRFHSARAVAATGVKPTTPALLIKMSTGPSSFTTSATTAAQLSSSATSKWRYSPPTCLATTAPCSSSTSHTTTLAPSAAKIAQSAAPIPWAPPVTIATLPSNLPMISSLDNCQYPLQHKGFCTGYAEALVLMPGGPKMCPANQRAPCRAYSQQFHVV